jgi:hypothetical protein
MTQQISIDLDNPGFRLEKREYPPAYLLHFEQKDGELRSEVCITLSPVTFTALLNEGQALLPCPEPCLTALAENTAWREAAWPLYRLQDRDWQLLVREVTSDALIHVLWLMEDLELARRVMRNFSERAAATLTEDLIARFARRPPDAASAGNLQDARDCLREVLDILAHLQAEGQIEGSF